MRVTAGEALETREEFGVSIVDPLRDVRWSRFVETHPDGLVYHHPAWLCVLLEEYDRPLHGLACIDADGAWRGILALLETRGFPMRRDFPTRRRLSSLPRTPFSGPLATDAGAEHALVAAAIELQTARDGSMLELRLAPTGRAQPHLAGVETVPWRPTYRLRLPLTADELSFGDGRARRRIAWACHHARRLGVELRLAESIDDVEAWHRLYLESMRGHLAPARCRRFFEGVWDTLGSAGMARLVLAERDTGRGRELVAGSFFLHHGRTVFYAFDGRRHDEASLRASDLIQRDTIRWACDAGFDWYDLGEVAGEQHGLAAFKRKWGAEPHPLMRLYLPSPARARSSTPEEPSLVFRTARRSWNHVPLGITARIGEALYARG